MTIHNFYLPHMLEKRNSKKFLIVLAVFWIVYLPIAVFMFRAPALRIFWTLFSLYQLTAVLYQLKNGLYLKPGEKPKKVKSVPPHEFLEKVKKEVAHGKK